ncbi:shikimate dehydrogenase [Desulfacinum hydrothermale DSM 13146]|uniref:Shikimate dehydrogenase (NADP(+)) n=1 Tax=Desulfacinum hydrothermale DSM 13146 TaxID=1121390 RepID=A0A1W1XFN6_9BACT|nr:shikimate dehydrogenase [Desulfacinum hydrothermale]SMC22773.1 shikimate dehydrogenase [Desulfacinum hydrothermale DSM 13146]
MARSVQHDLYGVVGNPVRHSLSPAMMNAALVHLAVPAFYLALESEDFAQDLEGLVELGLRGLSVTIPHKETALGLCAWVDEAAREIGAVNTLRWSEKGWEGRNTDWIGAVRALQSAVELGGQRALVLGAGGAAKAVIYGLVRSGLQVTVANRTEAKARDLAARFGCHWVPLAHMKEVSVDLVVHCTAGGLRGRSYAFALEEVPFRPGAVVMDIVYSPLDTPFLQAARAAGASVVDGLEMLLHQGVEQLSWWLGRPAPESVMRRALRDAAGGREGREGA